MQGSLEGQWQLLLWHDGLVPLSPTTSLYITPAPDPAVTVQLCKWQSADANFYGLAEPSAVPALWQRRLQFSMRHLPRRPGAWRCMKAEVSCKAKREAVGWLGLDAASGGVGGRSPSPLGSSRFPFFSMSVCVGHPSRSCPLQMGFDLGCNPGLLCWGR